jgi:subtilisin family serine protease
MTKRLFAFTAIAGFLLWSLHVLLPLPAGPACLTQEAASGAGAAVPPHGSVQVTPVAAADMLAQPPPTTADGEEAADPWQADQESASGDSSPVEELHWPDFKHPAVLRQWRDGRPVEWVANQVLVTMVDGAVADLVELLGTDTHYRLQQVGTSTVQVAWDGASAGAYAQHFGFLQERVRAIAVVEPNYIIYSMRVPNDPRYAQQGHLTQIGAEQAWERRTDSSQVKIALLDTGIERQHPDLATNIPQRPGEIPNNGSDDDGNGYIDDVYGWNFVHDNADLSDHDGHGTHVAGVIAARGDNNVGVAGITWQADLLIVRILDHRGIGTIADEVRGVRYARENGARLINASYGGTSFSQASLAEHRLASEAGIWVVAAAGNENRSNSNHPVYPASHDLPTIISVAAANAANERSNFSNYGRDSVDLFAPGVDILSTARDGGYGTQSGTSHATALVSGALALLLAAEPGLDREQYRTRLLQGIRYFPQLAPYAKSGGMLHAGRVLRGGGLTPAEFLQQPQPLSIDAGKTFELAVVVDSNSPYTIQWYCNDQPIHGATGSRLSRLAWDRAQQGHYHAVVSNSAGSVASATVWVSVLEHPPRIVSQSRPGIIVTGMDLVLRVQAAGTMPMSYQWYRDGLPVPGATEHELRLAKISLSQAGDYQVLVENRFGNVWSGVMPVLQPEAPAPGQDYAWINNAQLSGLDKMPSGFPGTARFHFVFNDRLFYYSNNTDLYVLDPDGKQYQIPGTSNFSNYYFIGCNGNTALFRKNNILYRLHHETYEPEAFDPGVPEYTEAWSVTYAGEYFLIQAGGLLWISNDGANWAAHTPPADETYGIMHVRNSIMAYVARSKQGIRFYVKSIHDTTWIQCHTTGITSENTLEMVSLPQGFLFAENPKLFFSEDGYSWVQINTEGVAFNSISSRGDHFMMRISAPGDHLYMASRNGLNWRPILLDELYSAKTSLVVYNVSDSHFYFSRVDHGRVFPAPKLTASTTNQSVTFPGSWRFLWDAAGRDQLEQVEVYMQGDWVGNLDPWSTEFQLQVPDYGYYSLFLRAVYKDGWITQSAPINAVAGLTPELQAHSISHLNTSSQGMPKSIIRYLPMHDGIFARFDLTNKLYHSVDGVYWQQWSTSVQQVFELSKAYSFSDGTVLINNRAGFLREHVGIIRRNGETTFTGLIHPQPTNNQTRTTVLKSEDDVLLVYESGQIWELNRDNLTWTLRNMAPQSLLVELAANDFHLVKIDKSPYLTRDFQTFHQFHEPAGWQALDKYYDVSADEFKWRSLVYYQSATNAYAIVQNEFSELGNAYVAPVKLDSVLDYADDTLFGTGAGLLWTSTSAGRFVPVRVQSSGNLTAWNSGAYIVFLSDSGLIRRLGAHDLDLRSISLPVTRHGAENQIQCVMTIENRGLVRYRQGMKVRLLGSILASQSDQAILQLSTQDVSLPGLYPTESGRISVSIPIPQGLDLGDYRLHLELESGAAFVDLQPDNNGAISPVFHYNPQMPLSLDKIGEGRIVSDLNTTTLPYGTRLQLEAVAEGSDHVFLFWTGTWQGTDPVLDVEVTGPVRAIACFAPRTFAEAYPDLTPHHAPGWFHDGSGSAVLPVHADWHYRATLGWLFQAGRDVDWAIMHNPEVGWLARHLPTGALYAFAGKSWMGVH